MISQLIINDEFSTNYSVGIMTERLSDFGGQIPLIECPGEKYSFVQDAVVSDAGSIT